MSKEPVNANRLAPLYYITILHGCQDSSLQEVSPSLLASLSEGLANVVEEIAPSIVRVDDGSRLTATGIIWTQDGVMVTTSHGVERDENLAIELSTSHVKSYPFTSPLSPLLRGEGKTGSPLFSGERGKPEIVRGALIALSGVIPVIQFEAGSPLEYRFIWLGLSIAMHAFPSRG